MADQSDEEFETASSTQQADNGQEGFIEEEENKVLSVSMALVLVLCFLFYVYVLLALVVFLIVPGSITPLSAHPVTVDNQTIDIGTGIYKYMNNDCSNTCTYTTGKGRGNHVHVYVLVPHSLMKICSETVLQTCVHRLSLQCVCVYIFIYIVLNFLCHNFTFIYIHCIRLSVPQFHLFLSLFQILKLFTLVKCCYVMVDYC